MNTRGLALTAALATVAAACAAPAAPASSTAATALPPASAASSAAPPATAVPASAAATVAGTTDPQVNLIFTGTVALTIQGAGGTCMLGKDASGNVTSFGWSATESDFAGLGTSFSISEVPGGDDVDVKWEIGGGAVPFFGRLAGGVTFGADHRSVGLDAELPPSGQATEHVKGTIVCP